MQIKINIGADLGYNSPMMRVELYKSQEAISDPMNHPEEIFFMESPFNIDKDNVFSSLERVVSLIDMLVNKLLEDHVCTKKAE